jgi:hypothetical protein
MKVAKLSTLALAAFTPKKDPWYSSLLEVEMTLGPQCCQEDKSIKKKTKGLAMNQTHNLSACHEVPQPTAIWCTHYL